MMGFGKRCFFYHFLDDFVGGFLSASRLFGGVGKSSQLAKNKTHGNECETSSGQKGLIMGILATPPKNSPPPPPEIRGYKIRPY